jgi:molecular chaperone DnaK
MPRQRPLGIDLGTTFSAAAWVNEAGRTSIIPNAEGEPLTPSVVLFADQEVVVGKEAREAMIVQPDAVAQWVKRDMGHPYYSHTIHGQRLPPEVIQACILRKLRGDILRALGRVDPVVITVPAYFDEPRRKATADAGAMAGFEVLDIVNEPTAAALAFGELLGYLTPGETPKEEMTLFVYDLGGGTFDATLLRLAPGRIETIATDGDVRLGGYDWDLRLAEHVADRFKRLQKIDPREDPRAMNRILAAAVEAKHALSARTRTTVRLELAGQVVEIPVTRQQFEDLTADLLERTASTSRQLVTAGKMEWIAVTRLLLVGGSTRMPMVVEMLRRLTGLEPDHTVHPDEAVARGAALYAAHLLGREAGSHAHAQFSVSNVNSHSLGVEGIDRETLRKRNIVLIPRNTPLPAKVRDRFATKADNQTSIVLQVLEGESPVPEECTAIGRTVIRDLPAGLPKNWPVEVTFEYASNGRLRVHGVVPGTNQSVVLCLERATGLSDESIVRWTQPIDDAAGFERFYAILREVLQLGALSSELPLHDTPPADALDEPGPAARPEERRTPGDAGALRPSPGLGDVPPQAVDKLDELDEVDELDEPDPLEFEPHDESDIEPERVARPAGPTTPGGAASPGRRPGPALEAPRGTGDAGEPPGTGYLVARVVAVLVGSIVAGLLLYWFWR